LQLDFPTTLKVEVFVPFWGSQHKLILLFHLHSNLCNCQHFKMEAFSRTQFCLCPKHWDVYNQYTAHHIIQECTTPALWERQVCTGM